MPQHPALAQVLIGTGDGRIMYVGLDSDFWNSFGTNWMGRLLELVRSELHARHAGM